MARVKNIAIENARIIFRNFSGKGDRFNPQGRRNFGVMIDNAEAANLEDEGWHIKWLKPKEEGGDPQAYLPVRVNFATIPPKVWMISSSKKTPLDESNISCLDNADLKNVDLEISPYFWSIPGKNGEEERGITAYLKTGYFTIIEDPFFDKYSKFDNPAGISSVDDSIDADEIPFS